MTMAHPIDFAEIRRLLQSLGFTEKTTDAFHVFHCAGKDLLAFRRYRDLENVDLGDIVSTRKFLDAWGLLDASDFDTFLERSTTTA
jgi:hypothetical protein